MKRSIFRCFQFYSLYKVSKWIRRAKVWNTCCHVQFATWVCVRTRKINYVPFKFSHYQAHADGAGERERARERMMYSVTCTIFQFAQDKIVPWIDLSITSLEYVLGMEIIVLNIGRWQQHIINLLSFTLLPQTDRRCVVNQFHRKLSPTQSNSNWMIQTHHHK